jgi:hypothetical protein
LYCNVSNEGLIKASGGGENKKRRSRWTSAFFDEPGKPECSERPVHGDFFADGFEEFEGGVLDGGGLGVEDEVGVLRGLERAVLAGEIGDFAAGGLGVEAFDVALFAGFVAGFNIDFEQVVAEQAAGEVAEFAAGSDGGDEGDDALGDEDFGDLGNAADVFEAVLVGEAEVGVEAGAEVVAVEDGGEAPLLVEDALGGVGDGGFPGAGQTAKPDDEAALAEQVLLVVAVEEAVELWMFMGKRLETEGVRG